MGYDRDSSEKSSNVLGAVLVAAAVGAVAGMLLAPKRGTETREDLMNKYNDVKNKMQDTTMDARDRINRGVDAARTKVNRAADKTKDATEMAADKIKDKTAEMTEEQTLADHIAAESSRRRRSM